MTILTELGFLSFDELTTMELEATAWSNRLSDAINQSAA